MLRRLPLVVGALAALAALVLAGPVAVAVALLRSSSDAQGPDLAAQIFIAVLVLAVVALAGLAAWGLTWLLVRPFRRTGDGRTSAGRGG
jgi:uncharacterized membrane protein YphA (DoxX/SURF4 family)